jgi:hypothetical protein
LFDDWDPIGVNDYAPKDEYDAYIGGIYRRLVSGGREDELSEHLRQLEITQMESPTNATHRRMVAKKLMKLNVRLWDNPILSQPRLRGFPEGSIAPSFTAGYAKKKDYQPVSTGLWSGGLSQQFVRTLKRPCKLHSFLPRRKRRGYG